MRWQKLMTNNDRVRGVRIDFSLDGYNRPTSENAGPLGRFVVRASSGGVKLVRLAAVS